MDAFGRLGSGAVCCPEMDIFFAVFKSVNKAY